MNRIFSILTFAGAAAMVTPGCADHEGKNPQDDAVTQSGTLKLPLQTFGESGTRYRLVDAIFEVRDIQTGRLEAVLNSEDALFSDIIDTELDAANYTVTLLPGWSILRSTDGTSPGPIPEPQPPGPSPFPTPTPSPFPTIPSAPTGSGPIGVPAAPGSGGSSSFPEPDVIFEPEPFVATGGSGSFPGDEEPVNAVLETDAVQFTSIFPNEDSFVFYVFRVGDNVISFEPGRLNVVFAVVEDGVPGGGLCSDADVARRTSVIETNVDALQFLSLRDAFDQMAVNEGFDTDGELLYQQIIDSYASAAEGQLPGAIHCGDEMTNGEPTLNGFPIMCDRQERFQFDNLDFWFPMAFVNRMDLAPQNGAHCGQQRMIFGNNQQGRMFFILEAQVPNPAPELGILGCAPLGEFWAQQVSEPDPFSRGLRLTNAFLFGEPQLQDAGFGPFVTASAYTVGSGQIRTNNFDDFIWTLREFKLADDGEDLQAIPFPVAESPNGELWNDQAGLSAGAECRDAFLAALDGLMPDNPARMSFIVPQACKNAESRNDFVSEDYVTHLQSGDPDGFFAELEDAVSGTGLDAIDIANRARFSGSCIGCHEEAVGSFLGRDVFAPFSAGFTHVAEFTETCPGGGQCFSISQALTDVFLPHRIGVLDSLVGVPLPPECEQIDPPDGDAGVAPVDPAPGPIDEDDDDQEAPASPPAPVFEPTLPDADTPTAELVELDEEEREVFGEETIGGQSAQATH